MQPNGNTANFRQAEQATVQHGTIAILRIGEAGVAALPSEAWIARHLPRLHAAEECLEGAIDAQDHVL